MSTTIHALQVGTADASGVVYSERQILSLIRGMHDQMDGQSLYGGPAGAWVDPVGVPEASRAFEVLGVHIRDGSDGAEMCLEIIVLPTTEGANLQVLLDAGTSTWTVEGTGLVEDGNAYADFEGKSVGF